MALEHFHTPDGLKHSALLVYIALQEQFSLFTANFCALGRCLVEPGRFCPPRLFKRDEPASGCTYLVLANQATWIQGIPQTVADKIDAQNR
jgi:hypothetical protein